MPTEKPRVIVTLSHELQGRLDAYCEQVGTSRSQVCAVALDQFLLAREGARRTQPNGHGQEATDAEGERACAKDS